MRSIRCIAALLLCLVSTQAYAAFVVPANDGYVTDEVGLITPEEKAILDQDLAAYDKETSNQIVVLIVRDLQETVIAEAAVEVLRAWEVGSADKNNGIVILLKYADELGQREIFIATGYGLEGAVPDIVAKGIVEEDMIPYFQDGDYAEGLKEGIDALKKHIAGEYTADRYSDEGGLGAFLFFILFVVFDWVAAFFGRTKSWWLGGIVGVVLGIVLTINYSWWLSIPALAVVGLVFDYIVSQTGYKPGRMRFTGNRFGGGGKFGGGGGFHGGGGSGGGGGAGGRW